MDDDEAQALLPEWPFGNAFHWLRLIHLADLPEEERLRLGRRATRSELALQELALVWVRLRDARLREIGMNRRMEELYAQRRSEGISTLTTESDGVFRDLAEDRQSIELEARTDHKTFFLFADLVLTEYVSMSRFAWSAPRGIPHEDGLSQFLAAVERVAPKPDPSTPFGESMRRLADSMRWADRTIGVYRDRMIVHADPSLHPTASSSVVNPASFYYGMRRGVAPDDPALQGLRETVTRIAQDEGIALDIPADARDALELLNVQSYRFSSANANAIAKLIQRWGGMSPDVVPTVEALARLLSDWGHAVLQAAGGVKEEWMTPALHEAQRRTDDAAAQPDNGEAEA